MIARHQVVVLAGETGSGKTTQLPKICLELGRGLDAMIGHTQPRRLAARTVAQRIAYELGETLGETVGYQVRFTDQFSDKTAIKLMTDGILLAEIQRDRLLKRYDTIIIDEAHERSLNIDFLLGYLKQLLPKRPDLKLIITSATIDLDRFSKHFDNAPIIEISGRTWPVTVHYEDLAESELDTNEHIAQVVSDVLNRRYGEPGDILVFLSGEREIREAAQQLRKLDQAQLEVLPLYARLSAAEQSRVFEERRRRGACVVLATNVAETSLTVPGIRFVIDPGYARISRYSYRSKMQRLPIEAISQASADQRKGRCGRVAEGVCIRLYGEDDFLARPQFTEPEIRRTNLAAVILQMLRLNLGAIENFPFLEPPDGRQIKDGVNLLQELGAVNEQRKLMSVGRRMSDFPVDPRFSRMLLAAADADCLRELLVIVSGLSVQDPRERPADKQQAADEKHRRFWHKHSDFMAWLALWDYCEEQRQSLSRNQWRKQCRRDYLSYARLLEWRDIHFQLTLSCRQGGLVLNKESANYESVHRSLLAGLLSNLGQLDEGHIYRGSRNIRLKIFPGSSLFKVRPKWLLAAEIVETSQVYARQVASIEPEWALEINPSLVKSHYFEPRWHMRTGRVMAYCRSSLYGLVLRDKQPVHYGPIDRVISREILVRDGLVPGRVRQAPAFLRHNRRLIEELEALESKIRRRDIVVDDQVQAAFYLARLPGNVTTMNHLKSWLKRDKSADSLMRMSSQQLSVRSVDEELGNQFPNSLEWQDFKLKLSYHFEPGHSRDGVSVTVPMGLLNRIPRYRFEWLVPGLLREKCIQLFKSLPKHLRKQLVPVPDFVDRVLAHMTVEDRPLVHVLSETLRQTSAVVVDVGEWATQALDSYYLMNIIVVDAEESIVAEGRDLERLIGEYRELGRSSLQGEVEVGPAKAGLLAWPEEGVPEIWRSRQAGIDIESYPALCDEGESVSLRLFDYLHEAQLSHKYGVLRLLRLSCADQVRFVRKQYLRGNDFALIIAGSRLDRSALIEDMLDACFVQAMLEDVGLPRSQSEFENVLISGRGELVNCANDCEHIIRLSLQVLTEVNRVVPKVALQLKKAEATKVIEDVEKQITRLFAPGFMRDTPSEWLRQYPRYCKALLNRLERMSGQLQKDFGYTGMLQEMSAPLGDLISRQPYGLSINPEARRYRWMLEEFRVSLFAQSLGTAVPVSAKRLQEQWEKVEKWQLDNPL